MMRATQWMDASPRRTGYHAQQLAHFELVNAWVTAPRVMSAWVYSFVYIVGADTSGLDGITMHRRSGEALRFTGARQASRAGLCVSVFVLFILSIFRHPI